MSEKEKTFPAPRERNKPAPYRQAAPPAPSAPVDSEKHGPIVEAPQSRDLLEELEKVEIDPRVLEEARSSNRAWGAAAIVVGVIMSVLGMAFDISIWNAGYARNRLSATPGIGIFLVVYGIGKWRRRGIDY